MQNWSFTKESLKLNSSTLYVVNGSNSLVWGKIMQWFSDWTGQKEGNWWWQLAAALICASLNHHLELDCWPVCKPGLDLTQTLRSTGACCVQSHWKSCNSNEMATVAALSRAQKWQSKHYVEGHQGMLGAFTVAKQCYLFSWSKTALQSITIGNTKKLWSFMA